MNTISLNAKNAIPEIHKRGMPVSIITGFLGSGKTTLLNQILQAVIPLHAQTYKDKCDQRVLR